jgi:uncharacterized protein
MKTDIENCEGFEWEEGNSNKNWYLHAVTDGECEDVFFNVPLIIISDKTNPEMNKDFTLLDEPIQTAGFSLLLQ